MNNSLSEITAVIRNKKKILITAHVLPDGDSVGSVVGLGLALESLGKEVYLVMADKVPEIYHFLEGTDKIIFPQEFSQKPDLIIFLDCGEISRAGDKWIDPLLKNMPLINIDHHISNNYFGTFNFVDPKAAATAELIYPLLKDLGFTITKEVASALYTGLIMDTGSFKYQNTTPRTLKTAAVLLESGVDLSLIRENLHENKSIKNLQLISVAIDNLHFAANGKIAWTYLDQKTMKRLQAKPEHSEGIVNYPISLKNVKIGLFFRETEDGDIKVGLRSRAGLDVNKIALSFNGGGHQQAAGCTLEVPLEEAIQQVLNKTISLMEEK
ncbi:MAG: DHH family phosphoesterase [Bacillota bacterium]|jgi:phosphoesterase RecJ-like protein